MSDVIDLPIKELDLELIQPNTKTYKNPEQGGSKLIVVGKPGCFTRGTSVLMFDGTCKPVEDVKEGEQVMGWDSLPRTVLELCRNRDEMYKIVPNKGEPYTVNKQHKLVLKSTGYNNIKKGTIIEVTVDEFLSKCKTWQKRWCIFRTSVDFPEKELEFDPYLFGLWLGDGSSCGAEFTTIDNEILDYAESESLYITKRDDITYRIRSTEGTKGKNPFRNFLRKFNLLKNKHIPHVYKVNSRENRLKLLAGIIDTDGYYDVKGNGYDIIQKNENILDDIIFIARSLGFFCVKKECKKSCRYKGKLVEGTYYRTFISGDVEEIPCKILRKHPRKHIKNHLVSGFTIEPQGEGDYYGFTIDGDHRFLLGSFDVVRNTGKTTLIASLLYAKKHIFPVAQVYSGTEDSNGFYRKMFPSTFVFNEYSEEQLRDFVRRQKIAKQHLDNPWAFLIVDDCTDDPSLFKKPLQQGFYKRGRHWKCIYLLSLQYGMDVLPVIRTNVDGVFILRETNLRNRRVMYENYAGIIPDFKLFCEIMDQLTNDYTALYIHNATTKSDWRDCVFWYKAKIAPENFKFGSKDFWDFHFQRYNPEYVDPIIV